MRNNPNKNKAFIKRKFSKQGIGKRSKEKGLQMINSAITVIIPAYNEENTIGDVISGTAEVLTAMRLPHEIIVVDDGSTDETLLVASRYNCKVLSNKRNKGKGYSLRKALKYATGDIIVTLDSDGEHKPKEIPHLLSTLSEDVDVVSGSRFLRGRSQITSHAHLIGNMIFNFSILFLTGIRITDSQTGFRVARKSFLENLKLKSDGFEIETEISVKCLVGGYYLKEVPITIERRRYNISNLKIFRDGSRIMTTIFRSVFLNFDIPKGRILRGSSIETKVATQTEEQGLYQKDTS